MLNRINQRVGLVGPLNLAGPCHQLLSAGQEAARAQGRALSQRAGYAPSRGQAAGLGMAAGLLHGWSGTMRCVQAVTKPLVGTAQSLDVRPMAPRNMIVETRRQLEADPARFGLLGRLGAPLAEHMAHASVAMGCAPAVARTAQGWGLHGAAAACQAGALVGVTVRAAGALLGVAVALAAMVALGIRAAVTWRRLQPATLPAVARSSLESMREGFASTAADNSAAAVADKLAAFKTDLVRASPGDMTVEGRDLAVRAADPEAPEPSDALLQARVDAAFNALLQVCGGDARSQAALAWLLTQRTAGILLNEVRPVTLHGRPQRAFHVGPCPQKYTVRPHAGGLRVSAEYRLTPVALYEAWTSDTKALCTSDSHLTYTAELALHPARGPSEVPRVELLDVRVVGEVKLLPADAEPSDVQLALV